MTTFHYSGECKGGPYDGQRMAHWSKTKTFYKPMVAFTAGMRNVEHEPVIPIAIGEYRLNDYHMWIWWETKDGAAYEQLSRHGR